MADTRLPDPVLRTWTVSLLEAAGLAPERAADAADPLLYASLHGIDSHGLMVLRRYLDHLAAGRLKPDAEPWIAVDRAAVALLDGDRGLGVVAGPPAMRLAVQKARQFGIGLVSVRNTSHFGAAGYYAAVAAAAGMVGLSASNVERMMPPFGGAEKVLGNNPIGIAAPTAEAGRVGYVLDFCTSEVAWGKLQLAARAGRQIPPGWAADADGRPTDDPEVGMAGMVLPLAGHKGSGLSFMLEVLTSALSGATPCTDVRDEVDLSQVHIAIDPSALGAAAGFTHRVDHLGGAVRATRPVDPARPVLAPGDLEAQAAAERAVAGIPLTPTDVAEIRGLSAAYGIDSPL